MPKRRWVLRALEASGSRGTSIAINRPTGQDSATNTAGQDTLPGSNTEESLLKTGALQTAIFNSANFSSIATDAQGVIQIFNVGAERMLGYAAVDVVKIGRAHV